MVKKYIRNCDGCGVEIKNLYDFGVTTLYKQIRIGRGHSIHDYQEDSIFNHATEKTPDDYDSYSSGWSRDESREFSFCSPECLLKFLSKLYSDTYNQTLENIKKEKKENLDISFEEFKKRHGEKISFFKKIQTSFSKDMFKKTTLEEADKLIEEIKKIKKEVSSVSSQH